VRNITRQQNKHWRGRCARKYWIPMFTHTSSSILGRDNRKINSKRQTFGFQKSQTTTHDRLGGWGSRRGARWCIGTRRCHDDWSHLDATIFSVHDKQATTRRCSRSSTNRISRLYIKYLVKHLVGECEKRWVHDVRVNNTPIFRIAPGYIKAS
jgi:hypothetical protein